MWIGYYFGLKNTDYQRSDGTHTFWEYRKYQIAYHVLLVNEYFKQGVYNVHKYWVFRELGYFAVQMTLPTGKITMYYSGGNLWNEFKCEAREKEDDGDKCSQQEVMKRIVDFASLIQK